MTEEVDGVPPSERTTLVVDTSSRCPKCGKPYEPGMGVCLPCSRRFGSEEDEDVDSERWITTIPVPAPDAPPRKPVPSAPEIEIGEIISEDEALRDLYDSELDEDVR